MLNRLGDAIASVLVMRSRFPFLYAIALSFPLCDRAFLSFMRSRFRLCDRFCISYAIASVLVMRSRFCLCDRAFLSFMRSLIPQQNPKTKSV
ncbi:MAG: hypothetical protein F6K53_08660 [Moorea sp. SIO4A1]|uniref:hypothetical protein n=1 Tax=Moorena sp. SIO4A1 TaxID=2607835 RepID=UPI00144F7C15|nr:hypothetical protein [Moorena sp. SIO4A1]NEQ57480.1 hypothetical protein [Moorena sp. SIO4A1]